jgi:hypothetical protein
MIVCSRAGRPVELEQRAAEADLRLKRLFGAVESGEDRFAGLKSIHDQARADGGGRPPLTTRAGSSSGISF